MPQASLQFLSDAKARGAFNTPDLFAQFLVNWAIRSPTDTVVDPCSGDGVFLEAAAQRLSFLGGSEKYAKQLLGVEIDTATAERCKMLLADHFGEPPNVIAKGFFEVLSDLSPNSFDAVIGNPPFVRYRNFFPKERDLAFSFMRQQGFRASKLTNAWVPFLVAAMYLLKDEGRLAMVMPAELFQVSYASEIREYLLNKFGFVFAITFNRLVFPGVEQEIVLLMGTKGEGRGLRLLEVKDETELHLIPRSRVPQTPVQDSTEKWTQYFLSDVQRQSLREALTMKRLGNYGSVDVGVVTGFNDFFILPKDRALGLDAENHLIPVLARTRQVKGVIYDKTDWENTTPSYLLSIDPAATVSNRLRKYLTEGESQGVNKHFKCRVREPWYVVPSVWIPEAFLYRQIGLYPRLVLNRANSTCTDTLHRVKFKSVKDAKTVVATFHNSLTFAFAEILGRSYGGGVLELMPSEAERLPVPLTDSSELIKEVDSLMREGLVDEAVSLVDEKILHEEIGFHRNEIGLMRSAWVDLARRRGARRPKKD